MDVDPKKVEDLRAYVLLEGENADVLFRASKLLELLEDNARLAAEVERITADLRFECRIREEAEQRETELRREVEGLRARHERKGPGCPSSASVVEHEDGADWVDTDSHGHPIIRVDDTWRCLADVDELRHIVRQGAAMLHALEGGNAQQAASPESGEPVEPIGDGLRGRPLVNSESPVQTTRFRTERESSEEFQQAWERGRAMPKRRWSVLIPISGAVHFTMESDEEPTFGEAVDYHCERSMGAKQHGEIEWEYMDNMHGEGNVMASHMYAEYGVSECAQQAGEGGDS